MKRQPDFDNILTLMNRGAPTRPTLYELFLNRDLYEILCKNDPVDPDPPYFAERWGIRSYYHAGYDYAMLMASDLKFEIDHVTGAKSISQNEVSMINDRESYERYNWPDPHKGDYSRLEVLAKEFPEGMKAIAYGPGGVLENVTNLMGFDNMCYMTVEDPDLLQEIFDRVGSTLLEYYRHALDYDIVGAIMANDDWGFSQQTMLSTADMRRYVFPWHKKIVALAHEKGKPAMLHSCGNASAIWEDIIEDIKFDAKHSYEDKICPVEEEYETYVGRIGIFGGMDVDFVCRSEPGEITRRAAAMLERSKDRGCYALGTGNSVPTYLPPVNYFAMIKAAIPDLKVDF